MKIEKESKINKNYCNNNCKHLGYLDSYKHRTGGYCRKYYLSLDEVCNPNSNSKYFKKCRECIEDG